MLVNTNPASLYSPTNETEQPHTRCTPLQEASQRALDSLKQFNAMVEKQNKRFSCTLFCCSPSFEKVQSHILLALEHLEQGFLSKPEDLQFQKKLLSDYLLSSTNLSAKKEILEVIEKIQKNLDTPLKADVETQTELVVKDSDVQVDRSPALLPLNISEHSLALKTRSSLVKIPGCNTSHTPQEQSFRTEQIVRFIEKQRCRQQAVESQIHDVNHDENLGQHPFGNRDWLDRTIHSQEQIPGNTAQSSQYSNLFPNKNTLPSNQRMRGF